MLLLNKMKYVAVKKYFRVYLLQETIRLKRIKGSFIE